MKWINTLQKIQRYLIEIQKDLEILERKNFQLSEFERNYLKGIKAILEKLHEKLENF